MYMSIVLVIISRDVSIDVKYVMEKWNVGLNLLMNSNAMKKSMTWAIFLIQIVPILQMKGYRDLDYCIQALALEVIHRI